MTLPSGPPPCQRKHVKCFRELEGSRPRGRYGRGRPQPREEAAWGRGRRRCIRLARIAPRVYQAKRHPGDGAHGLVEAGHVRALVLVARVVVEVGVVGVVFGVWVLVRGGFGWLRGR